MNLIERQSFSDIKKKITKGKVIVISGARRVGKTFLLKKIISEINEPYLLLNGDDYLTQEIFRNKGIVQLKQIIGKNELLVIDEAQKIENIGSILKILVDEINNLSVIVTGSSVFDISNKLGEPLTGRKYTFYLYPIAQCELNKYYTLIETRALLESRLLFGSYPELIQMNDKDEKTGYLSELVNSYLLKDILVLDNVKNSSKLLQILRLLAFQIGSEVSLSEISRQVGISKNTVERYIDLFTKVFILFRLSGYSRNLRKEISKSSKYYFWDNGIRNILIANFNSLDIRNDTGQLWENYIISERMKWQTYNKLIVNNYFWRTYDQQEIDWIEERSGNLFAYEIKYKKKQVKVPIAWKTAYPESKYKVINSEDYLDFIS